MNPPPAIPERPATAFGVDSPVALGTRRALTGYGRAMRSSAVFAEPSSILALRDVLTDASELGLSVACRGSGRSYGDAALNEFGLVLSLSGMRRILAWDAATGIIDVEPGVTIEDLWRHGLPQGYWPAVVPGTMFPTVGGCVAMNIHGKNHFAVGGFGDHVLELDLLTSDGALITCNRAQEPELFRAVIGGMGLLGVTTRIRLQMKRIYSGQMKVIGRTAANLDALFELFDARLPEADYLVGLVDAFARGGRLGRAVIHEGYSLAEGEDSAADQSLTLAGQELPKRFFGLLPRHHMWRLLRPWVNRFGMRWVNRVKYNSTRFSQGKPHFQSHAAFAFLLDYIPRWREAYGREGFIQVQPFVPADAAKEAFKQILTLCQKERMEPYLAVFKRHRKDEFLLSHALDGYSLAMDFRVTEANRTKLWQMGQAIGDIVVSCGGRFYFAKDALTRPDQVLDTFGKERLDAFYAFRRRCDPGALFSSELSRRALPSPT